MNAKPDRPTGPLKVICPACEYVNEFPAEDTVFLFVCHNCGEPIEVDEGDSEA
jgi:hypothetical protein